ncbi:hypothetical protein CB1_000204002 [Camelus ferus]|nr:hypothetical protein CB1_000204002 [Camelus ferus]
MAGSWSPWRGAGLGASFSICAAHQHPSSVRSQLEPCLPVLPAGLWGVWTVLSGGAPEMTEQEVPILRYQLQVSLGHALDTSSWKILSQVLFIETRDPEGYYESLSELQQKGYREELQGAREHIQEDCSPFGVCQWPCRRGDSPGGVRMPAQCTGQQEQDGHHEGRTVRGGGVCGHPRQKWWQRQRCRRQREHCAPVRGSPCEGIAAELLPHHADMEAINKELVPCRYLGCRDLVENLVAHPPTALSALPWLLTPLCTAESAYAPPSGLRRGQMAAPSLLFLLREALREQLVVKRTRRRQCEHGGWGRKLRKCRGFVCCFPVMVCYTSLCPVTPTALNVFSVPEAPVLLTQTQLLSWRNLGGRQGSA